MNKNLKIIFSLMIIIILFDSCDPMDDRFKFTNNINDKLYVSMFFLEDSSYKETGLDIRIVESMQSEKFGTIFNWDNAFSRSKSQIMDVVVFRNALNLKDIHSIGTIDKRDSLIKVGAYVSRQYSYSELLKKDWRIIYPEDGFSKGLPKEVIYK